MSSGTVSAAGCFKWDTDITLTGRITKQQNLWVPYLDENGKERKEILVLNIATPICIDASGGDKKEEKNIETLQLLLFTHSPPFSPRWLNRDVSVSGTLIPAQSKQHYTKALIGTWKVTPNEQIPLKITTAAKGVPPEFQGEWGLFDEKTNTNISRSECVQLEGFTITSQRVSWNIEHPCGRIESVKYKNEILS